MHIMTTNNLFLLHIIPGNVIIQSGDCYEKKNIYRLTRMEK